MNGSTGHLENLAHRSSTVLVDTVHLCTSSFDRSRIGDCEHAWTSLKYSQGVRPFPTLEHYPTGHYHDPQSGLYLELWRDQVRIQLSLPRFIHGTNTHPITTSDIPRVTSFITDELARGLGLCFFCEDLNLTRLDLFKDFSLNTAMEAAIAELRMLTQVDRLPLKPQPTARLKHCLLWANSRRELTAYDKTEEARSKYKITLPDTRLRLEYRLTKRDSCRREGFFGISSLSDTHLQRRRYCDALQSLLTASEPFRSDTALSPVCTRNELVDVIRSRSLKEVRNYLLKHFASEPFHRYFGGRYNAHAFLDSITGVESHKKRNTRELFATILSASPHERELNTLTIWDSIRDGLDELRRLR